MRKKNWPSKDKEPLYPCLIKGYLPTTTTPTPQMFTLIFPEVATHVDDEYAWAGVEDPKIMITTSHSPSSRLKQFAKELRLIFPNSQRLNRGNYVMSQLVQACRANDVTDLIIAHEHRGEPGMIDCLFRSIDNPKCAVFSHPIRMLYLINYYIFYLHPVNYWVCISWGLNQGYYIYKFSNYWKL